MSDYREVILETFKAIGEQSSNKRRVRPVEGQNLSSSARVRFDEKIRYKHPLGTKFKILAKVTDREGGKQYLFTSLSDPCVIVSNEEANVFINNRFKK